ncbi:hypothetical protein BT96DRAFT_829263 [Gymnopus androsaceus JB14]|uniref:LYC1 C-terminal domain-containing protein n=1 Tax=Gymnopus androsaceus JB14 TaxID=1447944 RepID=A0A6A4H8G3_9AGAR|nr:hypothetical protein BT96DRAFT_829263 [Gymnopus androsaceus JB14]
MDASTLSIFVATPQQTEVSRRRTWASPWGSGMTLDEFLRRDMEVEKSECGSHGKLTTWVLAPRDNPETLDFLCSCEIFRRSGLTARENSVTESEPLIEHVDCYGVASIFTLPEYRKKGYARLMSSLLHWVLAGNALLNEFPNIWGAKPIIPSGFGNATFSTLWSDVGDFYERCGPTSAAGIKDGWITRGTHTMRWLPKKNLTLNKPSSRSEGTLQWRWLDNQEALNQLWIHDTNLMRSDLLACWHSLRGSGDSKTKAIFTFLPSGGVEGFQRGARLKPFWKNEAEITKCGSPAAFATWTLSLRPGTPRTLILTRLRAPHISHLSSILQLIWEFSQEHNIEVIEVWNFPKHLRGDDGSGYECIQRWFEFGKEQGLEGGGEEFERKEHLPSFKWYGHGGNSGLAEHEVEWAFNER